MKRPNFIIRIIDALLRNFGYGVFRTADVEGTKVENDLLKRENTSMIAKLAVRAVMR